MPPVGSGPPGTGCLSTSNTRAPGRAAAMAGSRLIDMVDEPHHVSGYGASAQQGNQQSDGSHGSYLRIKLMFYFTL